MFEANNKKVLSDSDFERIRKFIYSKCGINLTTVKKTMVQSRLFKILQRSQYDSYTDYLNFALNSPEGKEDLVQLVDVITTNKTDFFREQVHFEFLRKNWLPNLASSGKSISFKVWSAGCSTGAEAFTTAIVLEEFKERNPNFDFYILASDISTKVLGMAKQAIYKMQEVEVIPTALQKKYLLKSKNPAEGLVRIVPELRKKVEVKYLNLIDPEYDVKQKFDLIFCRNVLIYFDRETQEKVINKLCMKLRPNGIFFLGHSESITSMQVPLKQIKPNIFRKI